MEMVGSEDLVVVQVEAVAAVRMAEMVLSWWNGNPVQLT
jgi:hypothetical protein